MATDRPESPAPTLLTREAILATPDAAPLDPAALREFEQRDRARLRELLRPTDPYTILLIKRFGSRQRWKAARAIAATMPTKIWAARRSRR
jgi:hypothetical protein